MTTLEERLRADLPELADALLERERTRTAAPAEPPVVIEVAAGRVHRVVPRRRVLVGAAAVVAAGTAVGLGAGVDWPGRSEVARTAVAGSPVPTSFGTWEPMAEAPIEPRVYAATAWTGSQVAFWAGTDLNRGFVQSDGALYDPATDTWQPLEGPGWGHPGLTSSVFDGELYALAKGGGTRFDPAAGEWRDLPPVEGMWLAATVATDDAVWGLGPADLNPAGQPDLAIARYEPDDDSWTYGPVWEGTDELAPIVAGLPRLESSALWTGNEIMVCGPSGECVAFDPADEIWRPVPAVTGAGSPAIAAGTELGAAILVQTGSESTSDDATIELLTDSGWEQRAAQIPVENFETATVASAGEWLVVFAGGQPPIVVHLPTGVWHRETDGPLTGVQAPNTTWTGDQLVVWGGDPYDPSATIGAIWTPPTG